MSVSRIEEVGITELGEGPHWHPESKSLYYIDILETSLHRYTPSNQEHIKVNAGSDPVSVIIPVNGEPDKFIISSGRKILKIQWDGKTKVFNQVKVLAEVDNEEGFRDNRINDGKCDPSGRLWFGTMGPEPTPDGCVPNRGSLYSLDQNGTLKKHAEQIWIANGLAWNSDATKMYYIDSCKYTVDEFDFDLNSGTVSNRKPIFSVKKHNIEGLPDGMTIDTDGNLWVAVFNSNSVVKIDPRVPETLLQVVNLPAKQPTSVAFGGSNMDELYVTTAKTTWNGAALSGPLHGALYRVTGLGAKGVPAVDAKL